MIEGEINQRFKTLLRDTAESQSSNEVSVPLRPRARPHTKAPIANMP